MPSPGCKCRGGYEASSWAVWATQRPYGNRGQALKGGGVRVLSVTSRSYGELAELQGKYFFYDCRWMEHMWATRPPKSDVTSNQDTACRGPVNHLMRLALPGKSWSRILCPQQISVSRKTCFIQPIY